MFRQGFDGWIGVHWWIVEEEHWGKRNGICKGTLIREVNSSGQYMFFGVSKSMECKVGSAGDKEHFARQARARGRILEFMGIY